MTISLMPLPYPKDALEPAISADTLAVHHGKHHKAYVDKTNEMAADAGMTQLPLEAIIAAAADKDDAKLYNQSAQVWNHGFYWSSLAPSPSEPQGDLAAAISDSFGTVDSLVEQLVEEGAAHFGSGWVWLVAQEGALAVTTTHDAGLPAGDTCNPLLVLDVWEHAYYLDRKNDRKAYLKAAAARLDWTFAAENHRRGTRWTYPG